MPLKCPWLYSRADVDQYGKILISQESIFIVWAHVIVFQKFKEYICHLWA